jgi:hypothetical protein
LPRTAPVRVHSSPLSVSTTLSSDTKFSLANRFRRLSTELNRRDVSIAPAGGPGAAAGCKLRTSGLELRSVGVRRIHTNAYA